MRRPHLVPKRRHHVAVHLPIISILTPQDLVLKVYRLSWRIQRFGDAAEVLRLVDHGCPAQPDALCAAMRKTAVRLTKARIGVATVMHLWRRVGVKGTRVQWSTNTTHTHTRARTRTRTHLVDDQHVPFAVPANALVVGWVVNWVKWRHGTRPVELADPIPSTDPARPSSALDQRVVSVQFE